MANAQMTMKKLVEVWDDYSRSNGYPIVRKKHFIINKNGQACEFDMNMPFITLYRVVGANKQNPLTFLVLYDGGNILTANNEPSRPRPGAGTRPAPGARPGPRPALNGIRRY